jgi:alpha-aminoadipic semialdehyde synthase
VSLLVRRASVCRSCGATNSRSHPSLPFRLLVVSDISCDVNGSIEFLERSTTIDRPFFTYDPIAGQETCDGIGDYGVTLQGVDILPTELPVESSTHFGEAVSKVLNEFVAAKSDQEIDVSKLSQQLVRMPLGQDGV